MAKIVVVEAEAAVLQTVSELFRKEGHEVRAAATVGDGLQAIEEHCPDRVVADLGTGTDAVPGLNILRKARAQNPPAEVIVMTVRGSVEGAVEAMRAGAHDYLNKPVKPADLQISVQRALSY